MTFSSVSLSRRGMALVLVLMTLVLVAGLTLAFFSRAVLNRQIAFTSTNLAKAEMVARGSLGLLVGELRQEMADPSHSTWHASANGLPVFEPTSPVRILPGQAGISGPDAAGAVTLVKVSGAGIGPHGSSAMVGSSVGIDVPSANGRSISAAQWFGAAGPQLGSQTGVPTWLMVTRNNGVSLPALAAAKDPLGDDYVVARFAYTVYDLAGLLDINAAGHPSGWSPSQLQKLKHTLAGADVSVLGVQADDLVQWRNPQTVTNYAAHVAGFSAPRGFRRVAIGDTAFLNRRDLLRASDAGVAGITAAALPHLTMFTRSANIPSWSPHTPAGSSIDYAAQANTPAAPNRFLPAVWRQADGSVTTYSLGGSSVVRPVRAGDSLLRQRFPLERLQWVGPNGPQNGGTAESIQSCFGLRWLPSQDPALGGAGVWRYVGPSGAVALTSIDTLEQVAASAVPREPNFFELLQAGMLAGSLGVDGGGTAVFPSTAQKSTVYQVLRIGAALIDQWDADSCPTIVEYDQSGFPWQACGVESLPYVNLQKTVTGGDPANPSIPNSTAALAVYHLVGLWNPNQAAVFSAPPDVRLRVKGAIAVLNSWSTGLPGYSWLNGPLFYGYGYTRVLDTTLLLANVAGRGVRGFSDPGLITAADVNGTLVDPGPSGNGWTTTPAVMSSLSVVAPGASYVGFRLPDLFLNANQTPPGPGWAGTYDWGYVQTCYSVGGNRFQCALEFQTPAGAWIPYSFAHGNNDPATWQAGGSSWQTHFTSPPYASNMPSLAETFAKAPLYLCADPRSVRFGLWQYSRNYGASGPERAPDALVTPLWPTAAQVAGSPYASAFSANGYGGGGGIAPADVAQAPPLFGSFYFPAHLARNSQPNTAPTSSYADLDGIRRIADSGLYTGGSGAGNPYQNIADRPIVLNRPFYSVAELGFAFRDAPWKTLDLFSAQSADAGLLDLFSVGLDNEGVPAGQLAVNTKDPLVARAILEQTVSDVTNAATVLGRPDAVAAALTAFTGTAPLANRGQLAVSAGPTFSAGDFSNQSEEKIKSRREAFLRSLSDPGQSRTWNLLIDLVAQSGRYGPAATGMEQFIVEGERRYWLHLAIDRFTGEVLDQQLEQAF